MTPYKQCLISGLVRILANVLMVGAIFLAMYQAGRWPAWPSELIFCLFFFGITIPVWLSAWGVLKWIRNLGKGDGQNSSPGQKAPEWSVKRAPTVFPGATQSIEANSD